MGYWNDMAAEIERVLGDQLNPTDAYGRPFAAAYSNSNKPQHRGVRFTGEDAFSQDSQVASQLSKDKRSKGGDIPIWDWGPPFPAPPGSERDKQNQRTGRAIHEWIDSWPPLPFGFSRTKETPAERERRCEEQIIKDEAICRKIKKRTCWESAYERHGACLTGKPLPPLVTW